MPQARALMSVVAAKPTLVRVSRAYSPPEQVEYLSRAYRERVVGALREQPGCVSAALLRLRRSVGHSVSVTAWISEAAVHASGQATTEAEVQAIRAVGGWLLALDGYELLAWEQRAPPTASVFISVTEVCGAPGSVDEAVLILRQHVVPAVTERHGLRAVLAGVNRETGRWLVMATWDTLRDLHAGAGAPSDLRRHGGGTRGGDTATGEIFEVAVAETWSAP